MGVVRPAADEGGEDTAPLMPAAGWTRLQTAKGWTAV